VALLTRAKAGHPSESFTLVLYFSSLYQFYNNNQLDQAHSYKDVKLQEKKNTTAIILRVFEIVVSYNFFRNLKQATNQLIRK
jgi:hypothetical protein